ncbi:MAG: putative two-component system response regulatory protein [Bacteroidota bacterium]|jgi:CheY-like chemotaxis protein|nr:putative two-component system response regulatory protein [Bacteroidota bacterium]
MSLRPKSILFVDDDEDDLNFITSAFTNLGIQNSLHTFNTGKELMEALMEGKAGNPCLIILDLNLQGLSGLEILDSLRKNNNYSKIPVVILSTSSTVEDIRKAISKGAVDYIPKPYSVAGYELIAAKLASIWCS